MSALGSCVCFEDQAGSAQTESFELCCRTQCSLREVPSVHLSVAIVSVVCSTPFVFTHRWLRSSKVLFLVDAVESASLPAYFELSGQREKTLIAASGEWVCLRPHASAHVLLVATLRWQRREAASCHGRPPMTRMLEHHSSFHQTFKCVSHNARRWPFMRKLTFSICHLTHFNVAVTYAVVIAILPNADLLLQA